MEIISKNPIVPENVYEELDEIIAKYNTLAHVCLKVWAVYYSHRDVEEGKKRFFLITNQVFPQGLEETIKTFEAIELQIWPCGYENADHPDFDKVFDYT